MPPDARTTAARLLSEFDKKQTRLDVLFSESKTYRNLDARDRRQTRALVSGVLRHARYLEWLIGRLYSGRMRNLERTVRLHLQLALFEIIHQDNIPEAVSINQYVEMTKKKRGAAAGRLVNAILRNYLRKKSELDPDKIHTDRATAIAVRYSLPQWLTERWIEQFGPEQTRALASALNEIPDFDVHINEQRITRADFLKRLDAEGIDYQAADNIPNMIKLRSLQKIIAKGWLDEGLCTVQDESAVIPVLLLDIDAENRVLDMCAAPGGKFVQLLAKKPKLAVAVDIDRGRLKRVRENVQRLGLAGGNYVVADGRKLPFKKGFDKILLDAPCSGLGVIRKHPDIKWRRSMQEINQFADLQADLLASASAFLEAHGKLVYSTCTIDYKENEQVVHSFVQAHTNWQLAKLPELARPYRVEDAVKCLPHRHHSDGSFSVILQHK